MSFARQIDEQRYRETTERPAQMPGATSPSFRCVACGRRSSMQGSKRTAVGSICASCHQARERRKAAKKGAA